MCGALGRDKQAFKLSTDIITALDRYDYSYLWSFMGLPIIQMPADVVTTMEVIWANKPDVIIETGVARGGSVIMMAAMLKLIGKGRVIGVDIDIRSHNRLAIESHQMSPWIDLVEGPSTAAETVARVKAAISTGASVMVILDSDHGRDHVLDELRTYGPLVTEGQFLVVADTLLGHVEPEQTPTKRSKLWAPGDEPRAAIDLYFQETDRFVMDEIVNGKLVLSSSPGGYLRCTKGNLASAALSPASITLRDASPDDFAVLAKIRRDQELQELLLVVPQATDDEAIVSWIKRRSAEPDGLFQVIVDEASGEVVGFVQISGVHRRNGYGFGGIALIESSRGRGIGRASMECLLAVAADSLKLCKLLLEVRADNQRALKLYLSMGFQLVGRMETHFRAASGRLYDVLMLEKVF